MIGGNAQQFQERVDCIKRYPTQQHSSGDPNINRSGSALKNMDLRLCVGTVTIFNGSGTDF
jgi:hypothetical protein